ncbi:MAG: InlB B-repeat-containing protein [Clostridia bacterium]|nr:InlB B-repeat-containing protein [Clostridia bacterium]
MSESNRFVKFIALVCAVLMLMSGNGTLYLVANAVEAISQAFMTKDLVASDGRTYRITVKYDENSGIPEGTQLEVNEITDPDEYDGYVAKTAEKLGGISEGIHFARAFDISLVDPETGEKIQPGGSVRVSIRLLDENIDRGANVNVVHFHGDADGEHEIMDARVNGRNVEFETDGFSVYVVVEHEAGYIETPRVEFHFLSHIFSEDGSNPGTYVAGPFSFMNKAGSYQNSQILKDGEALEMIANPPNIETENDNGTKSSKYFFGWYLVEHSGVSSDGNVSYIWSEDPEQIKFEKNVAISDVVWANEEHTAITSLKWTMDGVEHEVSSADNSDSRIVLDAFGCAHVYLAPIYQDYYFVNFHAGIEGTELGNSILMCRLVVLGSDGLAEARIGDVHASSADSRRKIFTGWEADLWEEDGQTIARKEMTVLDDVGEEYNSGEDKDGFYITLTSHDLYQGKQAVDLYPIFTETRWFHFITGKSGNGATYVGDAYVYTTDQPSDVEGGTARYYLTDLPISSRTGFRFKGWFADPTETDSNGDYLDGRQITDENGRIVNGAYTKYAADDVTPLYQMKDGRLYAYKDIPDEGITLYAHWEEVTETNIQIIVWKQKISDSKNAYDHDKTYDFEAAYNIDATSGLTLADLRANDTLDTYEGYSGDSFTGFHYRTTEMNTATVRGDGTTVVNVYYDRDLMTIYFYYNGTGGEPAYTYTATTANTPEEQYGIVEGKYVRLTRRQGSGTKYTFRYNYQRTTSDTITPQYALVISDGVRRYVELTRTVNTVTNTRWRFRTGGMLTGTTRYMDQGKTDGVFYVRQGRNYVSSGYNVNNPPEDTSVTYYCKYNNRYYELTPQSTTTTTYVWKNGESVWTGDRYLRLAGTAEYTGDRRTIDGVEYGVDSRGGYVELVGTSVAAYQWYTTTHVRGYFKDNDNDGTQRDVYGLVDDEYVKLTPVFGSDYTYKTEYTYTGTTATNTQQPDQYGIVNGEYVKLSWDVVDTTTGWSISYVYTPTTSTEDGYYYLWTGNNNNRSFQSVRLYYNEGKWYRNREWNWYRYEYSNEWTGGVYERTTGSGAYSGTVYGLTSNGEFTTYRNGTRYGQGENGIIYQLGNQTSADVYGWTYNYAEYTGARYTRGAGANWTGDRYTRSGSSAPYTYTPQTGNPTSGQILYILDGNGGHVKLNWTVNVSGYTYEDESGTTQNYEGDRYTFRDEEVDTEYTGTRYTRGTSAFNSMITYTGLYGQTLAQNGYTWPSSISGQSGTWWWYDGYNSGLGGMSGTGTRTTFLEAFLFSDGGTVATFYGFTGSGSNSIYFYKEALDGSWVLSDTMTVSNGTFNISDKYTGFIPHQYSTNGSSWTTLSGEKDSNGYYGSIGATANRYIRFKRLSYDLVFDPNYPTKAGTTINGTDLTLDNVAALTEANTSTVSVLYETPLSGYSAQPQPAQGPDNYTFTGWYVDEGCTVKYTFNENMPAANMRLYAGWEPVQFRIEIDPNGAEFDHIDHRYDMNNSSNPARQGYSGWFWDNNGSAVEYQSGMDVSDLRPFATFNRGEIIGEDGVTVERPADNGWAATSRYSTYINATFMEPITEYTEMKVDYVPVSDAFAANYSGAIYYYMNAQYQSEAIDGTGLPSANRNALYLTEEELHQYYLFYKDWVNGNLIGGYISGTIVLDEETWKETYLAKNSSGGYQKYRRTIGSEHFTFLGWYKLDSNGNPEPMPYNFADPVTGPFTLKAYWRLDAGYQIRYHADYVMEDGTIVNGEIPYWTDPEIKTSRYAADAGTHIYRQPTGITANGIETDEYIFRGWQLVNVSTNSHGQVVYTPIEDGVYYDPGDRFTILSAYADRSSVIHMQAVYEQKDQSYRRPYVTNLTLHANGGFMTVDGENELTENTSLTNTWPGVIGEVVATVNDNGVDTERIEFGDFQSNEKVRLYRYATDLTHVDGDDSKPLLDPAGKNYFKHPDGYFLLGFDKESNEGDYIATYPADSIISISRKQEQTVYAVWEPMVYIKVVNATGVGPVTFGLSSSEGALQVVNAREGLYGRTPMTAAELSAITVDDGDYAWLAVPYGVVKEIVNGETKFVKRHVTIEGTNNLGPGWLLTATSTLDGENRDTLVGSLTNTNADFKSVQNLKPFGFNEELEINPEGIVITFTAVQNPHTLELDDNYPTTGVRTQEVYFDKKDNTSSDFGYDIVYGQDETLYYELPTTSTRIGYIFLGWDPNPNWAASHDVKTEKPAYTTDGATGWMINSLNDFFLDSATGERETVKTLYAVWDTNAEARIVNVYKEVPEPGDKDKEFTFTVSLSGKYEYQRKKNNGWTALSGTFDAGTASVTLKDGEYIRTEAFQFWEDNASEKPYIQVVIQKFNSDGREIASARQTLKYSWDYYDRPNSKQGDYYYDFIAFYPSYSVTENDYSAKPHYYDTAMSCVSLADGDYPLTLGSTSTSISALPVENVDGRVLSWSETEAGGTVIFTNTRQTADVTVKKVLESSTSAAGIFNFTASYTLGGETTDLGSFSVTSGTDGKKLEKIPVGAVLTVTETGSNLGDYITTVTRNGTNVTVTEATEEDDGVTNYMRSVSYTVAKGDTTITYKNVLKSYPIIFYKVDQDGNAGVPSYFRLSSSTGTIAEQLYPAQTGTGEFFPGNSGKSNVFYVGTYTLEETFVGENFLPLDGPVTLTLSSENGGKLEGNSGLVVIEKVDENDPTQGFKVFVYNVRIVTINIRAELSDPILTNVRRFSYIVEYSYELLGKTVTGTATRQITSGSGDSVKVPANSTLKVTEELSATDAAIYDVSIVRTDSDDVSDETVEGAVYRYGADAASNHGIVVAENDGDTLTFTNKRKTVKVTVEKLIDDYDSSDPDNNVFRFKVLLRNGGIPITGYEIGTANEYSADGKTNLDGAYFFDLSHGQTKELTVPSGARITVQEFSVLDGSVSIDSYSAGISVRSETTSFSGGNKDEDGKTYDLNSTLVPITVTFTNGPAKKVRVILRKIDNTLATVEGARFAIYRSNKTTLVNPDAINLESGKSGAFWIGELATGTYYIKETTTPDGYKTLDGGINWFSLKVNSDGTLKITRLTSAP